MTDFDVARMVEFEIEQLTKEIQLIKSRSSRWCVPQEMYDRLHDAYELRIQQLKDSIWNLEDEYSELEAECNDLRWRAKGNSMSEY